MPKATAIPVSLLLKMIPIDVLLESIEPLLGQWLASTLKNLSGKPAKRVIAIARRLHGVFAAFLAEVEARQKVAKVAGRAARR